MTRLLSAEMILTRALQGPSVPAIEDPAQTSTEAMTQKRKKTKRKKTFTSADFAKWGRQGGLAGSRASKVSAAHASHKARNITNTPESNGKPDQVEFTPDGYKITFKGVTRSVSGWAYKLRMPQRTIRGRITRQLPVSEILAK